MFDKQKLRAFAEPYYVNKDIMHNMWHIHLVENAVKKILAITNYEINYEHLILAMYFHGFVYQDEERIRQWLLEQNYGNEDIDHIVTIAWESQRCEIPATIEGKILHDAHILEGGKTYPVTKTLITGSLRGQSFEETLEYMQNYVLDQNICYLPETIPLCNEMNRYTNEYFEDIIKEIGAVG